MQVTSQSYENHQLFLSDLATQSLADGYILGKFAPADLDLKQSWAEEDCVFLFLRAKADIADIADIDDGASLTAKLKAYLMEPVHRQVRFLWIENPDEPLSQWRSNALSVDTSDGKSVISQLSYLDLRNYSFSIARGTSIALDDAGSPTGFILNRAANNPEGFELASGYGEQRLHSIGEQVLLPMQGEFAGCVQFNFHVEKKGVETGVFGYPDLRHLDIGFRLFMRDPDFPETGENVYLSSHRYPLIDEDSENDHGYDYYPDQIAFKASFDPLYPLAPERTHLIFQPPTGDFATTGLPSSYRTNLGYSVHLLPVSDQSRLQFALRPAKPNAEEHAQAPFYLIPAGEYELVVPRYLDGRLQKPDFVAEANVICGLSGLEYVKVTTGSPVKVKLIFVPEQPAYVPAYSSINALLRDLPTILESFSERTLPPDTTDLDMRIEEGEGLGISDDDRQKILEIIRQDYFPPHYQFTQAQLEAYNSLEIVEKLIEWLRIALQAATYENVSAGGALTPQATTSWVYVRSGDGAVYYAQPDQAPLYKAEASSQQFLDYLEVPSVGLPNNLDGPQGQSLKDATGYDSLAFPMLPYGNVDAHALVDIRQLETALVNNYRRNRIHKISEATKHVTPLKDKDSASSQRIGTTPQGLIATFSEDCRTIERLQLMKDTNDNLVSFVNIVHGSPLKAALQSNQLFMVISDPAAVNANFSKKVFTDTTSTLEIKKWLFELGTEHWDKKGTLLIFKFHDKPLLDLAENPDLWSLPNEFNGDKTAIVSQELVRLLKQAVEIGKSGNPKERRKYEVLARAATQPNWTGILALNVDVPLRGLPDSLKALAAGMDPDLFYAQYVGVEVTPVQSTGTELVQQQSSLFGLIDYSNPNIPLADASGYNFHVPLLSIVFQNSEITDFAAEVLIILDRLFDEATTLSNSPDGKNILRLQGVAEEHNGQVTYSFGFSGANHFLLSGKVMQEVEIVKAQFATDPIPDPKASPLPVKGRFFFWGRVKFAYLPDFDVLSFGSLPGTTTAPKPAPGEDESSEPDYLSMSNLQIVLSFELNETTIDEKTSTEVKKREFKFNPNQLAFDLKRSGWRKNSLYEKFPLKLSGFRVVKDDPQALAKSGYMPVKTPGKAAELGESWYGLTFELNLGSAGALAGGAGLVVSVLAAWNPEKEGLYVGLKLPGSSGGKKEIVIQGLLKIVFKSIQFVVYPLHTDEDLTTLPINAEREVGYLLKIKNVILKFFVLSFPPSGQTEFILFGDPRDVKRKDKLLGWYAAYARKK